MRNLCVSLVVVVCLLAGLVGCKPALPDNVLSKDEMAEILYDYHLALAMARSEEGGDQGQSIAYREAVLKKHGVSSADFDSSMVYYVRHTELLEDVYKGLGDRLSNEITNMGGNGASGEFANLSATGDTANVWNLRPSMVLSTVKPFNYASFDIKVDSGFHKGDRLMLDFDAQFIYQDGMRDGIALLAVRFKNDSIAQSVVHVQNSQHYSAEITDQDSLGIKSVKGYFLLADGSSGSDSPSRSTLKLMFLERIKLIRMHPKKVVAAEANLSSENLSASPDSMRKDSAVAAKDSSATPSAASAAASSAGKKSSAPTGELPPMKTINGKALKPMKIER